MACASTPVNARFEVFGKRAPGSPLIITSSNSASSVDSKRSRSARTRVFSSSSVDSASSAAFPGRRWTGRYRSRRAGRLPADRRRAAVENAPSDSHKAHRRLLAAWSLCPERERKWIGHFGQIDRHFARPSGPRRCGRRRLSIGKDLAIFSSGKMTPVSLFAHITETTAVSGRMARSSSRDRDAPAHRPRRR